MGTLKSTGIINVGTDDQPTYRPAVQGHTVNGVLLGEPLELDGDPMTYEFDDSAFPNGTVELIDGEIVVTPDETDTP